MSCRSSAPGTSVCHLPFQAVGMSPGRAQYAYDIHVSLEQLHGEAHRAQLREHDSVQLLVSWLRIVPVVQLAAHQQEYADLREDHGWVIR